MTKADVCVLAVDAAKARCFWLLEDDEPGSERVQLQEGRTWVHPEARLPEHERFKDSYPRGHKSGSPGKTHPLDDHREAHSEDEKRRFAGDITTDLNNWLGERGAARVVVCTSHAMGSLLAQAWEKSGLSARRTDWITAEVAEWSPVALHEYLSQRGILAAPKAPRLAR